MTITIEIREVTPGTISMRSRCQCECSPLEARYAEHIAAAIATANKTFRHGEPGVIAGGATTVVKREINPDS